jgi:hypothetical protein
MREYEVNERTVTKPSTTAAAIDELNAAIAASRSARAVDLFKPGALEPWEIEDALNGSLPGHEHDACPARTVGNGPTVCMIHDVEIPR